MLAPSKPVDAAWHAFLLHTRDYEAYCLERFGRLVHHEPAERADRKAYARAYQRRRERYGTPAADVWPITFIGADAACGDSGGGSSCGGGGCGGGGG